MNEVTVNGKPRPTGPVKRMKVHFGPQPLRCKKCDLLLVLANGHPVQKHVWAVDHQKVILHLTGEFESVMMPTYYCDSCGRKQQ